MISAFIYVSKI